MTLAWITPLSWLPFPCLCIFPFAFIMWRQLFLFLFILPRAFLQGRLSSTANNRIGSFIVTGDAHTSFFSIFIPPPFHPTFIIRLSVREDGWLHQSGWRLGENVSKSKSDVTVFSVRGFSHRAEEGYMLKYLFPVIFTTFSSFTAVVGSGLHLSPHFVACWRVYLHSWLNRAS